MDKDYTIKQVGNAYRVFINLGNGMSFLLQGSYATIADAESAYNAWRLEDDKRRNWYEAYTPTGARE
jgi:hypothetical protein